MKTPSEAARESNPFKVSESIGNTLSFNNGFLAGVAWAERFIPVSEELPEYYKDVLVKYQGGEIVRYAVCWLSVGDNDNYLWTSLRDNLINHNEVIGWRAIEHGKE